MTRNIRELMIGFTWGTLLVVPLALWALWEAIVTPVPYRDVHVLRSEVVAGRLVLDANFIKNDACTAQKLEAKGQIIDQWYALDWEDRDGRPVGEDRIEGHQTLRLAVDVSTAPTVVEIWTRHICGGVKVDRMFARMDLSRPVIPPATQSGHGGHLGPVGLE